MNFEKIQSVLSMSFDRNVAKSLFKIYGILKEDPRFTLSKYAGMMRNMLKGERIVKHEGRYVISTFLPPFPSRAFETNIMAVKEKNNIFTQQAMAVRSAPISIYLSLTSRCPNNCIYCSEKNKTGSNDLSTDEWIRVIGELQDMNTSVIGFTGGDPMTRSDIFDIIESVDERSTSILFTSGFNLDIEKARKLKKSGLFAIGISLDSHLKDVHNKNRRSEKAFDFALEAIRNSAKAGLYTMVQTVVTKDSVSKDSLMALFRLAGKSGAHEVKLLDPMPSGRMIESGAPSGLFHDELSRTKMIQIQHEANKIPGLPKITSFAYTESPGKFGCGAGTQHSYISSNGDMQPCDFVPMSFGNVRNKSISTLWENMNKHCKIPRLECLSRRLSRSIVELSKGSLPLSPDDSARLLAANPSKGFPKYYRDMQ